VLLLSGRHDSQPQANPNSSPEAAARKRWRLHYFGVRTLEYAGRAKRRRRFGLATVQEFKAAAKNPKRCRAALATALQKSYQLALEMKQ